MDSLRDSFTFATFSSICFKVSKNEKPNDRAQKFELFKSECSEKWICFSNDEIFFAVNTLCVAQMDKNIHTVTTF